MTSRQLSVTYCLSPQQSQSNKNAHILPITKILNPVLSNDYFLTISRDGSIILHPNDQHTPKLRLQIHSDWISDVVEINQHEYVTVSHDFAIILVKVENSDNQWKYSTKIIGYHNDYIKSVCLLNDNYIITSGLDSSIKIWEIKDSSSGKIEFKTSITNSGISNYAMAILNPNKFIIGDSNGDLVYYEFQQQENIIVEIKRIRNAHDTNIKVIKLINNNQTLISACSNAILKIWDVQNDDLTNILSQKWDCNIWSIDTFNDNNDLIIGDSNGNIFSLTYSNQKVAFNKILNSKEVLKEPFKKHLGILDLKIINNTIYFSYCSDSNLTKLNLSDNSLEIEKGGVALIRSSLLTNRRHVITENTLGKIQRWDIISCELINTFNASDGDFDEVVVKYTSKEILAHWCSVSIKVGILFIKIGPKFLNTEVYGSALNDYHILNNVSINPDNRYNLGKIFVNSFFNDFIDYELSKDKQFRNSLSSLKKNDNENTDSLFKDSYTSASSSDKHNKDKPKKKSAFMKLSSSITISRTNTNGSVSNSKDPTPYISVPTTPIDTDAPSVTTGNLTANDAPLESSQVPPSLQPNDEETPLIQPSPSAIPKPPSSGRTLSSGSLLSRKFKSLRSSSNRQLNESSETTRAATTSVSATNNKPFTTVDDPVYHDALHNFLTKDIMPESITFPKENGNNANIYTMLRSNDASRLNSELTMDLPKIKKQELMPDLLLEFHESYIQQYNNYGSSLKLLTKKLPDSLIKKSPTCPLLKIKSNCLILVHSWNDDACGGRVIFSTMLPHSSSATGSTQLSLSSSNSSSASPSNFGSSTESLESTRSLSQFDVIVNKNNDRSEIFENLEKHLPYWFAKNLCDDTNVVEDKQPRLNFTIMPWTDPDSEVAPADNNADPISPPTTSESTNQQFVHMLKFGRSKTNDSTSYATDLPKVAEANTKLVAPGMIKVKKIKMYVIDRFETKTPEMKSKVDPSEWLELLCKEQVLDNDMTLSTVKTLYWKSTSEIILHYRRKS
ncbi:hypothetical protein KAFR_0C01310 [Kazachstania africana CBS 2517]|uniref:Uncharacterized protein n=1 Tax=Kazachstania africana (strain ATCC 22294 / BCRC 22015 / CBS 2517 / CECT 1963 / NBRC 1671 / NRRL Y-8276) TaxID=1071382 RepID=H2ARX4_KAZAF|nr:hypothetical protein KAFR_0C01310 [Kazachstania africana CBS 2517]CCF57124.1 hypothetical protein KAFR_0C01310 [Kazachstania africana CBS 2517]